MQMIPKNTRLSAYLLVVCLMMIGLGCKSTKTASSDGGTDTKKKDIIGNWKLTDIEENGIMHKSEDFMMGREMRIELRSGGKMTAIGGVEGTEQLTYVFENGALKTTDAKGIVEILEVEELSETKLVFKVQDEGTLFRMFFTRQE